jgi:hypothetical protein
VEPSKVNGQSMTIPPSISSDPYSVNISGKRMSLALWWSSSETPHRLLFEKKVRTVIIKDTGVSTHHPKSPTPSRLPSPSRFSCVSVSSRSQQSS